MLHSDYCLLFRNALLQLIEEKSNTRYRKHDKEENGGKKDFIYKKKKDCEVYYQLFKKSQKKKKKVRLDIRNKTL